MRQALAGVLLLGLACSAREAAPDERPVLILHAEYHRSTRRLAVSVDSCRADVEAEAVETAEAVRITVTATGGGRAQETCSDGHELQLAQRLGGRRVVDDATGERVPVMVLG